MSSIKAKIVGRMIIFLSVFLLVSTVVLVVYESLGEQEFASKNNSANGDLEEGSLIDVSYYKDDFSKDPYEIFTIQHLHPYYNFSLPWRKSDQAGISNSVVTLEENGFRHNPYDKTSRRAILLGGSTAFGHFSSDDEHTLASKLSEQTDVHFVNRNAPSWNTHQELVALAKYSDPYVASISFTLPNDIGVACEENSFWNEGKRYLDSPESFIHLYEMVNDVRGSIKDERSLSEKIGDRVRSAFPDTRTLLDKIKGLFVDKDNSSVAEENNNPCENISEEEVADSFLKNQEAMSALSRGRGANHIVVLQPHLHLITKHDEMSHFMRTVYDTVMGSEYCSNNLCLDLSDDKFGVRADSLFTGSNIETALFADPVHLTDLGVAFYSELISSFLEQKNVGLR